MELPAIPGGRRPLGLSTRPPYPFHYPRPTSTAATTTGTLNSHRSNSSPARPRPNTRPPTPPLTLTHCHTPRLAWLSTVSTTAGYVTREDICRRRKLDAFIFFFSDATTAQRGVYHNNVECMRNELIPRHRLIENRAYRIYIIPVLWYTHIINNMCFECVCVRVCVCVVCGDFRFLLLWL